jgi:hypothetical protein
MGASIRAITFAEPTKAWRGTSFAVQAETSHFYIGYHVVI